MGTAERGGCRHVRPRRRVRRSKRTSRNGAPVRPTPRASPPTETSGWRSADAGSATGDRRLFEDRVCVGAAEAKRAHAGAPPLVLGATHGDRVRRHHDRQLVPADQRIGLAQVQVRRNRAMLQREHGLDHAGDAGGRFEVADVGLDRADAAAERSRRAARSTAPSAFTSIGSPSDVPVPCAST